MELPTTNAFELQRQQIIARNRARLLALGIPEAVAALRKLAPVKKPTAPRAPREPQAPSRHSSRLRDREMIARGEVPPDVEEGSELAQFIIDGECPRCGKVLSGGHQRHLDICKGPPEPPTEEDIAAKAEAYRAQQKDKLQQLELAGLVDYLPAADEDTAGTAAGAVAGTADAAAEPSAGQEQQEEHKATAPAEQQQQQQQQQQQGRAKKAAGKDKKKSKAAAAAAAASDAGSGEAYAIFIVIGSKGDHYAVKLNGAKRTCQCLDHRFRRHDCKHIRLILQQLGVAEEPTGWQQALSRQLDTVGAADEDDVQRVKAAEERALARKRKAAAAAAADATEQDAAAQDAPAQDNVSSRGSTQRTASKKKRKAAA